MSNLMDYLDWRGDLTFKQAEFNEVDNLILSQLPYVELQGIVPGEDTSEGIRLQDAARIFFETHEKKELLDKVSMTRMAPFVLEKMAATKRFKEVVLSRYVNEIDTQEESQFCAVCAALDDGTVFVSYSGTDCTIIGWKEDFNMSFLTETPGQLKSVEYLNYFAREDCQRALRIGGHSKGGNLSGYAAIHCEKSLQEKILMVYSNDGPGFSDEEIATESYQNMKERMHTIIPESSIVGMLLEHAEKVTVVQSTLTGAMQHDGMSWQVLGNHFVKTSGVSRESRMIERALKSWILSLAPEQREEFVDTLFGILESASVTSTEELGRIKWKTVSELIKAASDLPKESQEMVGKVLKMLWMEATKSRKYIRQEEKNKKLQIESK